MAAIPATHLLAIDVQPNRSIDPGTWLRATELDAWLRGRGFTDAADQIRDQIEDGSVESERKVRAWFRG